MLSVLIKESSTLAVVAAPIQKLARITRNTKVPMSPSEMKLGFIKINTDKNLTLLL